MKSANRRLIWLLIVLFTFLMSSESYAEQIVDFDFQIGLVEATPILGDIAYIELEYENLCQLNARLELPCAHHNYQVYFEGEEASQYKGRILLEKPLNPYMSFALKRTTLHPGQQCSIVTAIRIFADDTKSSEGRVPNLQTSDLRLSKPSFVDICFHHASDFDLQETELRSMGQSHELKYRLPYTESVILGDPKVVADEMKKLHDGEDRCVRWKMFPDFATRYPDGTRLRPGSNLARLHQFATQYTQALEKHQGSQEEFFTAVEKIMSGMHELERRWLALQMFETVSEQSDEIRSAWSKRLNAKRIVFSE